MVARISCLTWPCEPTEVNVMSKMLSVELECIFFSWVRKKCIHFLEYVDPFLGSYILSFTYLLCFGITGVNVSASTHPNHTHSLFIHYSLLPTLTYFFCLLSVLWSTPYIQSISIYHLPPTYFYVQLHQCRTSSIKNFTLICQYSCYPSLIPWKP